MIKKDRENYVWVLQNLWALYNSLEIEISKIIVMNQELILMNIIVKIFPTSNTRDLLCIWHVNKAIFMICRTKFSDTD